MHTALLDNSSHRLLGFPGSSDGKESAWHAGDLGLTPALEKSPGVGNGNPLQYSRLENPMDRGAWRAAISGVSQSRMSVQLSIADSNPLFKILPDESIYHSFCACN